MTGVPLDPSSQSGEPRDLEARVDELKDQIRRSHTRLSLLSDTILTGGAAGSRAEIIFRNEMSSAFRLIKAAFIIDGAVQYNRQDETGVLADQKEIPLFSGAGFTHHVGESSYGWSMATLGNLFGLLNFLLKSVVFVTIMMWVRWTLPRLRIDQVMMLCLKYLIPIGCILLAGVSVWVLFVPVILQKIVAWVLFGLSMAGLGFMAFQLKTWASALPGAGMPGMWRMEGLPGYQGATKS